jgi:hypothetical protein
MQKIDDCKEIRLALTRAGIATRFEKCLQTFRLVVTAQCIYYTLRLGKPVLLVDAILGRRIADVDQEHVSMDTRADIVGRVGPGRTSYGRIL